VDRVGLLETVDDEHERDLAVSVAIGVGGEPAAIERNGVTLTPP
jgi:hypothetical protein